MKSLPKKFWIRSVAVLLLIIAITLFMMLVDPTRRGLVIILVPIVLGWMLLFLVFESLFDLFKQSRATTRRFFSAVCASAILFFLLLSGIGTFSVGDVILTLALVLLVGFYVSRT